MEINSTEIITSRLAIALFVLCVSLGVFLLLWALEKFIRPDITARIWDKFYFIFIAETITPLVGVLQTLLAIALIISFWRPITYGIALGIHGVSTLSTWKQILDPWGLVSGNHTNHLFLAAIPVLAGFVALYLLYPWDSWSVDSWRIAKAKTK